MLQSKNTMSEIKAKTTIFLEKVFIVKFFFQPRNNLTYDRLIYRIVILGQYDLPASQGFSSCFPAKIYALGIAALRQVNLSYIFILGQYDRPRAFYKNNMSDRHYPLYYW